MAKLGLRETPGRASKAIQWLTSGYQQNIQDLVNGAIFPSTLSEMVVIKDIEVYSLCEHHLMPFIGKCHVAYLPQGHVIGLSKIPRIVDMFARRLQIQERFTEQIANALQEITGASGVGIIIEAQHLCLMMGGVEKQNTVVKTSMMLGTFRTNSSTRTEFLSLVR